MTCSNNVVLSYYDSLLRTTDVAVLNGPHWLNDAVIGFYFEYLDQKLNKDGKKRMVYVGPELTQLLKMSDTSQYGILLDPIGVSEANFVFFVLNNCDSKDQAGGSHWSLLVYCQEERTCYHLDSCRGFNSAIASAFAGRILCYITGKPGSGFLEPNCPQQENSYDCGVHVLCLTDVISEHALKTNKISGCDYSHVKQLARTKRSQLLDLINQLKNK